MSDERFSSFLEQVASFYGVQVDGEFSVFFARFPSGPRTSANIMSGNAFILNSPVDLPLKQGEWDTIVAHELVHYLSSLQSDEQKRALSDRFLKVCPIPDGVSPFWLIEEPLAVAAGQVAYSELVLQQPLNPRTNWYFVPWIDLTARTIAPSVMTAIRSGITLEESTIPEETAERCRDMTAMVAEAARRQL